MNIFRAGLVSCWGSAKLKKFWQPIRNIVGEGIGLKGRRKGGRGMGGDSKEIKRDEEWKGNCEGNRKKKKSVSLLFVLRIFWFHIKFIYHKLVIIICNWKFKIFFLSIPYFCEICLYCLRLGRPALNCGASQNFLIETCPRQDRGKKKVWLIQLEIALDVQSV